MFLVRWSVSRLIAESIVSSNGENVSRRFEQYPLLIFGIVFVGVGCENRPEVELEMSDDRPRFQPKSLKALPVELRCSFPYGALVRFVIRQPIAILGNVPTTAINPQVPFTADSDEALTTALVRLAYLKPRFTEFKREK